MSSSFATFVLACVMPAPDLARGIRVAVPVDSPSARRLRPSWATADGLASVTASAWRIALSPAHAARLPFRR
jgi:hypothetical protein